MHLKAPQHWCTQGELLREPDRGAWARATMSPLGAHSSWARRKKHASAWGPECEGGCLHCQPPGIPSVPGPLACSKSSSWCSLMPLPASCSTDADRRSAAERLGAGDLRASTVQPGWCWRDSISGESSWALGTLETAPDSAGRLGSEIPGPTSSALFALSSRVPKSPHPSSVLALRFLHPSSQSCPWPQGWYSQSILSIPPTSGQRSSGLHQP